MRAKIRLSITLDDHSLSSLKSLSKRFKKSVSSVGRSLIEKALKLEEDAYFSRESDERLNKKVECIPHRKAWK